jgi:DNA-binding MarR family transcriptional regulator
MRRLAAIDRTLERLQRAFNDDGIDITQVRAFLMLAKASIEGDPLTTEDLRRLLNVSSSYAHRTVTQFAQRGLVERKPAIYDCRAKLLQLTSEGRAVADEIMDACHETVSLHASSATTHAARTPH